MKIDWLIKELTEIHDDLKEQEPQIYGNGRLKTIISLLKIEKVKAKTPKKIGLFLHSWIDEYGSQQKIHCIKHVRSVTGLGLKEAKDLVEMAPCIIMETPKYSKEQIDILYAELRPRMGNKVEIRELNDEDLKSKGEFINDLEEL